MLDGPSKLQRSLDFVRGLRYQRRDDMKLLLISASPRKEKSRTFILAREVLRGATGKETDTEILHLCDFNIEFCRQCESCHRKILLCPIRDDVHRILTAMLRSDALILASPNYINHVTASMKALFDRSSHFIHCLRLMDKYTVGVVSSGSGRDETVLDYIRYYSNVCGAQYSDGISSQAPASERKLEEASKVGEKLYKDVKARRKFPDQLDIIDKHREHFRTIILNRRSGWAEEYEYWSKKGWL